MKNYMERESKFRKPRNADQRMRDTTREMMHACAAELGGMLWALRGELRDVCAERGVDGMEHFAGIARRLDEIERYSFNRLGREI